MASTAQDVATQAEPLSDEVVQPFPASRKIHVTGSRGDINVPMREIALAPTETKEGPRENPPLPVYDTSGPYTDADATIELTAGPAPVREARITERGDTEVLPDLTSAYGRERGNDTKLASVRFPAVPNPRRAAAGATVSHMHYARRGIVTPEMEYIAIRENARREQVTDLELHKRHPGQPFGAHLPRPLPPSSCATRWARAGRSSRPTSTTPSSSR